MRKGAEIEKHVQTQSGHDYSACYYGYLNFAGTKVGEEELADVGASAGQESDMEALLELSDEDGKGDIASLDSDTEDVAAENFLNENMQTISDQDVAALTDDAADSAEEALDAEVQEGEIPGEAVYTNSGSVSRIIFLRQNFPGNRRVPKIKRRF